MDTSLLSLLGQFQRFEYIQVAMHMWFICDYFELFPLEFDTIWRGRWGWQCAGHLLYLLCRYTTFFTLGTVIYSMLGTQNDELCLKLGISSSWMTFVGIACAQLAFFLRAYALWHGHSAVGVFLVILAIGMIGAGITINVLIMCSTQLLRPPIDNPAIIPRCYLVVDGQPELAMWGAVSVTIVDSVLMVMAVAAKFKANYSVDLDSLAYKVYRDAIYYFVVNFAISITSILLFHFPPGPFKQLSGIFPSIMTRCLACHIILRLRVYSRGGSLTFTTTDGRSLGPLEFYHSDSQETSDANPQGS